MPRRLNLPDSASVAEPRPDGQLFAPSAERNAAAICDLVADHAPDRGRALEIASGTGQHVVALSRRLPDLTWQPSDVDPVRRRSIDAWVGKAEAANVAPAIELDATAPGWGSTQGDTALVLLVNLLHLVSTGEAKTLISEVAQALSPGGVFVLYGPFLRDGEASSDGDAKFHDSLRRQDTEIGYKDNWDVIEWLQSQGLELVEVVEMPANNLAFVSRSATGG
ncbi:class I SAM-dependent methyltransferase [Rhodobacteraceae bacterium D3-12]|nr:class I SAM-dependent methyltransferase [Rhodobacteraceae bacterium D3-12]